MGWTDERVEILKKLWLEGLSKLWESPVFGLGAQRYPELFGLGAHNSFVECYVELGLVGGTLFLSAVYLSVALTYRLGPARLPRLAGELARVRPYLVAIGAGYAAGMLTSSRNYMMPTYMLFGLAAADQWLAVAGTPRHPARLDQRMVIRLLIVSGVVLIALYAFAQMSVRWQ